MSISPAWRRAAGATVAVAVAVAATVTPATPASALAYVSNTEWTSGPTNTEYCNQTGAAIAQFGDEPDSLGHPSSASVLDRATRGRHTSGGTLTCDGVPAIERWLVVRLDLLKWADGYWLICRQTSWQQEYGSSIHQYLQFPYGEPPCGEGYYGTFGAGYRWDGAWRGGWVWSGYHYFRSHARSGPPAGAPAEAPPPRPAWVNADGTVEMRRVPTSVETLDEHGLPTGRSVTPARQPTPRGGA